MEIKSFPNNVDEYIGAEYVMKWLHGRTSGVFAASNNLKVSADTGMTVRVPDGIGWITSLSGDGSVVWNDYYETYAENMPLTLSMAHASYARIDRIVVSLDTVDFTSKPTIEILEGTASVSPSAPALTRTASKYMISLAQIYVGAAATSITAANITDERLDTSVCGLVTESLSIDTSAMFAQYSQWYADLQAQAASDQSDYEDEWEDWISGKESDATDAYNAFTGGLDSKTSDASDAYDDYTDALDGKLSNASDAYDDFVADLTSKEETYEDDFETWFEGLQDQLSGNVATNLQNQINTLNTKELGLQSQLNKIKKTVSANGWSVSPDANGYYTQSLTVNSLTASDYIRSTAIDSDDALSDAALEAYLAIDHFETASGSIICYAESVPASDVDIDFYVTEV